MIISTKLKYWALDLNNLGFYHVLSVNMLLKLFGFASQLFVAWWLTTEEIGQFSIMQSFLMYIILLGGLGFNTSTLKLCSEKRSIAEKILIHKKALLYSLFLSIASVIIFLILNFYGFLIQNIRMRIPFSLVILSAIPMVLNGIDTSYLQALREFKKLAAINFIARIITLVLLFALTYSFGLYGLIIANIIGNILTTFLQYRIILKINKKLIIETNIEKNNSNIYNLHIKYSLTSFFTNIVYMASAYIDMLIINYIAKDIPYEVGRYAFVMLILSFFLMISDSVRQVIIPLFSENSNCYSAWISIYNKYKKILIISYSFIGFTGFIVIPYLVNFVYGDKFGNIQLLLFLLILSWFQNSITSFLSSAIFGAGELKINFYNGLIILPIAIILKYLMILHLSILGAAISTLIVSFISVCVYLISFKIVANRMLYKQNLIKKSI